MKLLWKKEKKPDGSFRVFRGGGWFYDVGYLRASIRSRNDPGYRNVYLGFRVVRKS